MIKGAIAIFQRSYLASFDELCLEPAFVCRCGDAFRTAAHRRVTNDAEGEGQSGAPEDADRPRALDGLAAVKPALVRLLEWQIDQELERTEKGGR